MAQNTCFKNVYVNMTGDPAWEEWEIAAFVLFVVFWCKISNLTKNYTK